MQQQDNGEGYTAETERWAGDTRHLSAELLGIRDQHSTELQILRLMNHETDGMSMKHVTGEGMAGRYTRWTYINFSIYFVIY